MSSVETIPEYVYREKTAESSLLQGDILKVEGQFHDYFKEFYPAIHHPESEDKYVMILTQSCDLVKTKKRKPKLSHVNVCLVRSFKAVIDKLITEEIKPVSIGDKNILPKADLDKLKDRLAKLLNNTDQKTHFFLPQKFPFKEDMVALLSLSFSFRIDHYDLLLQSRILGLKTEFQAKVGHIISQLYGRIGTSDLSDHSWDDKKIRAYIKKLLDDANLIQVMDGSVIQYIETNFKHSNSIEKLIEECDALKTEKAFRPLKNELMQTIKKQLIQSFEDKDKLHAFANMDKINLSKEIDHILKYAINDGRSVGAVFELTDVAMDAKSPVQT